MRSIFGFQKTTAATTKTSIGESRNNFNSHNNGYISGSRYINNSDANLLKCTGIIAIEINSTRSAAGKWAR
jgi:hypothetical protein